MQDRFKCRVWHIGMKSFQEPFALREGIPLYANGEEWECDYIVSQCTGLKDKNGKLIFEGDIVEIDSDTLAKILWSDYLARFIIVYENIQADFDNYFGYELEVIDNIYESEIPDGQSPVSECEVDGNEVKSTTAASAKEFQDNPELLEDRKKQVKQAIPTLNQRSARHKDLMRSSQQ